MAGGTMQVLDSNAKLLYGLFQSICGWALENGYRDISTMKNLLKLAMVDVCRRRYEDQSPMALQLAVVADLGISLRNAQYSLKAIEDLADVSGGAVHIREAQREILMLLTEKPRAFEEILNELSFLIHAPYDLQKKTLLTILKDLEEKNLVVQEPIAGHAVYRPAETHVDLFDPTDLGARLSGLLSHLDYYRHTRGKPFFEVYRLTEKQARGLQTAANDLLRGSGNEREFDLRQSKTATKPYYFYLGSAPLQEQNRPYSMNEALLDVIQTRFRDANSASLAKAHWYHLTLESAKSVFHEVREFISREGAAASLNSNGNGQVFAYYVGMTDRRTGAIKEGIPS
jgi:DNA-binding HxlR family transcriptional regulator